MEENKVIRLNIEKKETEEKTPARESMLHTNPILGKMFAANLLNNDNKKKFKLSDWLK